MNSVTMLAVESARALRRVRRNAVTASVAILSLGVAVAVAGLAGTVLRQLAFPHEAYLDEASLAQVYATNPASCRSCIDGFSARDFVTWQQAGIRSFSQVASYRQVSLLPEDRRERSVSVAFVDEGFFTLLGTAPALGRVLTADDHASGALNAVSSNRHWRSRLGGRESALGSVQDVGGRRYRIVGVMPAVFRMPEGADLWVSAASDPDGQDRDARDRIAVGRLREGVQAQGAQAELTSIAARNAAAVTLPENERGIAVFGSSDWPGRASERSAVWVIGLTAVGLVLLCLVNVSHVFSVGVLARLREYSIRRALGASDAQLRTGVQADAGVIAALAAGVSVVVFAVASAPTADYLSAVLSFEASTAPVTRFALFAPLVSAAFSLGLVAPAMKYVQSHATHLLLRGSAASTPVQQTLRHLLVALQLVGVFVVVSAASLLVSSYRYTRNTTTGFDDAATVVTALQVQRGASESDQRGTVTLALHNVEAALQSDAVAVWSSRPLDHFNARRAVLRTAAHGEVFSMPAAELWQRPYPGFSFAVSPQTFSVLGVAVTDGRAFTDADGQGAPPVAIVNEAAARHLWPNASAIGQQLKLGDDARPEPWLTVVGVVKNTALLMSAGLDMKLVMQGRDPPLLFQPYEQAGSARATLAVRRPGATAAEIVGLDRLVESALPQSVRMSTELTVMRRWLASASMVRRVERTTDLMLGLAIAAVMIALIGVYGLADELVRSRTSEIALRRALGAPDARIVTWIGARLFRLFAISAASGTVLSLGIATMGTRLLYGHRGEGSAIRTGLAHGVSAHEPRFYLAAALCCALMLVLGAARPLVVALRIRPADALRSGE